MTSATGSPARCANGHATLGARGGRVAAGRYTPRP